MKSGGLLAVAAVLGVLGSLPVTPSIAAPDGGARSARIPLAPSPRVVLRFCRDRAHRDKFPVLCPTRWPHVGTSSVTGSGRSVLGPSFYWASFNDETGFDDGDNGHLVIGGQRPAFSLRGRAKQTWPRPGQPQPIEQLGLPRYLTAPLQGGGTYVAQRPARILTVSTVGRSRALVLVAPAYPMGGLNGGHVIVVWNRAGHGYFVSLHYNGSRGGVSYAFGERARAALAVARSARAVAR